MQNAASGFSRSQGDLLDRILRVVRIRFRMIGVVVAIFLAIGVLYLHLAVYRYEVTMQVTPVTQSPEVLPGNLQNLASMAGLNLPSSSDEGAFQLYMTALLSRRVADELAKNTELMRQLYPRDWSEAAHAWRTPHSPTHELSNGIKWLLGVPTPPWQPPSGADLALLLNQTVSIEKTRTSPVITVSVITPTAQLGIELLQELHNAADKALRDDTLKRTRENIAYLRTELSQTTVADYREAILRVLADQEKQQMMASSNVSYVAQMFGSPVATPHPVSPNALVVLTIYLVLGLGSSIGWLWLQDRYGIKLSWPSIRRISGMLQPHHHNG